MDEWCRHCRTLQTHMSSEPPFFFGERFSMVDVFLAPIWQRVLWWIGVENIPDEFGRLMVWWKAVCRRPSVAATLVCKDRLLTHLRS